MAFLDWLMGRREPADPDMVRDRLFEAVSKGDKPALDKLCNDHTHLILDTFAEWRKVPEDQKNNPGAAMRWGQGLVEVARHLAEMGEPEPLQSLMGTPQENPLQAWQQTLDTARERMERQAYSPARDELAQLLVNVQGLRGTGADALMPTTAGMLGECCFQLGEAERAAALVAEAAAGCARNNDVDGQVGYLMNLVEVHRWRGNQEEAAKVSEQIAALAVQAERPEDAERWSKRAALLKKGEPLVRLLTVVDDRPCEIDELPLTGQLQIQFVFERDRITLRPCSEAIHEGEQLASGGELEKALEKFRAAAQCDPHDPQSHYLAGLTLLHLSRFEEAAAEYETCAKLAPGWFHVGTQLWIARELAAGRLKLEDFVALREVEDSGRPPEQKLEIGQQQLAKTPQFAPMQLAVGDLLFGFNRGEEGLAALRAGHAAAAEPDVKSRLAVRLALAIPDERERKKLLESAIAPDSNLVAAAMAKLSLRSRPA